MGTTPRGPFISRGWGDITAQEEAELSIFNSEPAMCASLWRTHANPQAKGKLVKASWTNSSKKSVETGSSGSLKRARSPTLLEYALDHLVPSSSRVPQGSLTSHEGSPDYSKWVSSDYFRKMVEWLANVNLGKPPSEEEEA